MTQGHIKHPTLHNPQNMDCANYISMNLKNGHSIQGNEKLTEVVNTRNDNDALHYANVPLDEKCESQAEWTVHNATNQ